MVRSDNADCGKRMGRSRNSKRLPVRMEYHLSPDTWLGARVWTKHTQSYNIEEGQWSSRRFYIWKPEIENEIPLAFKSLAYLIGTWHSSFDDHRAAKMTFTWGKNRRFIKFTNAYKPEKNGPYIQENEGVINYHGIRNQLIFRTTYLKEGSHLIADGHYQIEDGGTINRIFTCHYKGGETLPWSDGQKAPEDGRSIDFKQIWTPIDANRFKGDFFWKRNGQWEHPIKKYDEKDFEEIWIREIKR